MPQIRFLRISSLVLLLALTSGCSLIPPQVEVQTKFVEKQIPIQGHPKGVTMYPLQFYAVTEENFEEFNRAAFNTQQGLLLDLEGEFKLFDFKDIFVFI